MKLSKETKLRIAKAMDKYCYYSFFPNWFLGMFFLWILQLPSIGILLLLLAIMLFTLSIYAEYKVHFLTYHDKEAD